MASVRIPYDSFTLSAVVAELGAYVGGKVQGIRQPNETDIAIALYSRGEAMLLLSCDPMFARAHFITKRPSTLPNPPAFVAALRSRIEGGTLIDVRQIQGDRVLELRFETETGTYLFVAELMGKHSNLILVEPGGRVFAAAKWVGKGKSFRLIQPGVPYQWPPVLIGGEDLKPSPFYRKLTEALGHPPELGRPVLSPGHGAYPSSVAALNLPEFPRQSISIALEQHYSQAIPSYEADQLRTGLLTQLRRVLLARETALFDLDQALQAGEKAGRWQRFGELLLAYRPVIVEGATSVAAWDYDGNEVQIRVDSELDFKENANRYFERAKKAKGSMGIVRDQIGRLDADRAALEALIVRVESAVRLDEMRALQEEARGKRWLIQQTTQTTVKEDRPYEGHRIRELVGPGGWTVLYGENAEANDYLTLRVAKPDDWWLHIRGNTSAHVVVVTRKQPDRVQRETLEFAAKVAVQHSPSKHGGYIPVDYTLRKYVRKPRGAAKGSALYTHEKTLHIQP
ncbi:Rqc2 family fibronectin-binding protein [Fimbriimonas ginsengisoli]|uniref:Fibronectin-binding A domain-containing protein n=1 Tax=Fimbriimonas ginsengisoli Gsoil 348 TaxID=661478 RepID=A0A068NWE2_FIMGI|nr:NFACT family protein [Fimbriimonas ginsengisoli]AIE87055.1 fibronectin-binding A domain-containing protein [Fimbriimonas ginsengisoli Gsoil 348]